MGSWRRRETASRSFGKQEVGGSRAGKRLGSRRWGVGEQTIMVPREGRAPRQRSLLVPRDSSLAIPLAGVRTSRGGIPMSRGEEGWEVGVFGFGPKPPFLPSHGRTGTLVAGAPCVSVLDTGLLA